MQRKHLRKIASFVFRWGIAVVGIWWVVANMSIADHALMLDGHGRPVEVEVLEELPGGQYRIASGGTSQVVGEAELINDKDRKTLTLRDGARVSMLAMDLAGQKNEIVRRILVADRPDGEGRWIAPAEVAGGFQLKVPNPKVEVGLGRMIRQAAPWKLVLAVAIFPITILLTSVRWERLLGALGTQLTPWRAMALNWVGLFYNTFIPMGSTGGDLIKAYYASTYTSRKTPAVLSVFIDRVIGLIVLIILGGTMAGMYFAFSPDKRDPAVGACLNVAIMGGLILAGTALGLVVAFNPTLRQLLGVDRILSRLPMQNQVRAAVEVMATYRQRPGLMIWAMVVTVPVHLTVIVSALLAGKAFALPLSWSYYFVVVPVVVLVGAIPISPQGAGVMEFFAINLTQRQGATVSQAFALTMSIRMVQIFWNLVGGVFLVTGHYRAPKKEELLDKAEARPV